MKPRQHLVRIVAHDEAGRPAAAGTGMRNSSPSRLTLAQPITGQDTATSSPRRKSAQMM